MDPKEVSKKYAKSYAADVESKSGSSMSVWGIIVITFFVIRIIMRFMRD